MIVTKKSSKAVICLLSALVFHDITDQVPADTYIVLPKGIKPPQIEYPSVRSFHLAQPSYDAGIQIHMINGIPVKIYGPEKTVVDCFQFRNKIGLEVALEALKLCIQKYKRRPAHFLQFARLCGVENIMLPYLEALS